MEYQSGFAKRIRLQLGHRIAHLGLFFSQLSVEITNSLIEDRRTK